jgi:2-polyprenyl-3-methyl-5-hydroxy-6-metoxy-1,4-benzoquinol methylase
LSHLTADLLAFIERWLPPPPARVVEVGCGDGSLTLHLLSAGFEMVGIDPHAPEGDCFQRTTIEDFRPTEPFDAAVAVGSLHHVANPERAADSLHSNLRSGARLVLSEFAVEHLDEGARRWLAEHGARGHCDHDYSDVIPLAALERALAARFALLVREPTAHLAHELAREDLVGPEHAAIAEGTLRPVGIRLVYERIDTPR